MLLMEILAFLGYFFHFFQKTDNAYSKCLDTMHYEWQENLSSKPKLRTFCLFKSEIKTEPFLLKYISRSKRSIFSQFRTGILPLEIDCLVSFCGDFAGYHPIRVLSSPTGGDCWHWSMVSPRSGPSCHLGPPLVSRTIDISMGLCYNRGHVYNNNTKKAARKETYTYHIT